MSESPGEFRESPMTLPDARGKSQRQGPPVAPSSSHGRTKILISAWLKELKGKHIFQDLPISTRGLAFK